MKKIAVITKPDRDPGLALAARAIKTLRSAGLVCILRPEDRHALGDLSEDDGVVFSSSGELPKDAFCAVVFGGDGTIMRLSHESSAKNIPILGVNLGRVGYLTEIEPDEIPLLSSLASDGLTLEKRMMLRSSIISDGKTVSENVHSLNDIVVSKGAISSMAEIVLKSGGALVGRYVCDGIIIATPTGSTAYSLAAGGSVIEPSLECISMTPLAPQSFYSKPIIFGGDAVLEVTKGERGHGELYVTCDGGDYAELKTGDVLRVDKSPLAARFIHIKQNHFCSVLNSKMSDL